MRLQAITHAHPRSQVACSIYIEVVLQLLNGRTPRDAYQHMQTMIPTYYTAAPYSHELSAFQRLLSNDISAYPEEEIRSSTYVNLGDDTDTTAMVVGGLAGLYYGMESIPESWRACIARKDDILDLANRLSNALEHMS